MLSVSSPIKTASDLKELLFNSKAQRPISSEQKAELERIAKLDVVNYSEADIRQKLSTLLFEYWDIQKNHTSLYIVKNT